jgi:hypothetical protein
MSVYIVTTSSVAIEYRDFTKPKMGKDNKWLNPPKLKRTLTIKGGANMAALNIVTPKGIATSISDADYEWLKDDSTFKRHVASGFMTVLTGNDEPNPNAVAGSMTEYDGSAPQNVDSGSAKHIPQASSEE